MHVEAHHTVDELEAAFNKEQRSKVAHRLRGVILAKQGLHGAGDRAVAGERPAAP